MFKVTARDQGHYKGPSGAFVTYCNISCSFSLRLAHKIWHNNYLVFEMEHTSAIFAQRILEPLASLDVFGSMSTGR